MATYAVERDAVGAYELALKANSVDVVEFASNLAKVEVISDGQAAIYFTVDGEAPTLKGENCFYLPAGLAAVREVQSPRNQPTIVQLISSGTPSYSVARVSA
jgi:hypothetical protein